MDSTENKIYRCICIVAIVVLFFLLMVNLSHAEVLPDDLVVFNSSSASSGTLITVPTGHTYTIRQICIYAGVPSADNNRTIQIDGTTLMRFSVLANGIQNLCYDFSYKLTAGKKVEWAAGAGSNTITYIVHYVDRDATGLLVSSSGSDPQLASIITSQSSMVQNLSIINTGVSTLQNYFIVVNDNLKYVGAGLMLFLIIIIYRWFFNKFFGSNLF